MASKNRRAVLQAILASGGAGLCPWTRVFAQSGSGAVILRPPKEALVIGNASYKQAPLRNAVRDAKSMTAVLQAVGFDVSLGLDLPQAEMREAIRGYLNRLTQSKAIGLFYFAGHGVQLAWRNYLLPVDAEITTAEKLRERGIDVNSVIEGIREARNPMNMIILDACRDNPFGPQAGAEQRGLSQLDAPPGTLLAYATAPGNVAADGEGEHGLYTEHLLREIKVPEAKVEDVFKRVRLGVRRRSNGQQIPWESTSLEEDFWFLPPADMRKRADAEAEREFRRELDGWEKIKLSNDTKPLEDYLRLYPSGRFSELAQLRLEQVLTKQGEKRVEVMSAPQNPYSKGSARTNTLYQIGDSYTYRVTDIVTGREEKPFHYLVTGISENEIIFNNGTETADLLGNLLKTASGAVRGPNQIVPLEFAIGKRWSTRFQAVGAGRTSIVSLELHIASREQISVPAGTFDCFRLEARGWGRGPDTNAQWDLKRWYAPERLRNYARADLLITTDRGKIANSRRSELSAFRES